MSAIFMFAFVFRKGVVYKCPVCLTELVQETDRYLVHPEEHGVLVKIPSDCTYAGKKFETPRVELREY